MRRISDLPHALGLAAGFTLAAGVWLALFFWQLGFPTWNSRWVYDLYREKGAIAAGIEGPRLLVVGGSGALFSIRAKELERQLGLRAVNLGTHAALNLDYLLYRARRIARPGDTILLAIEHELYSQDPFMLDHVAIDQIFARDPAYLEQLPLLRLVDAILRMGLRRALLPLSQRDSPPALPIYSPYALAHLDEHGDTLGNNPVLKSAATRTSLRNWPRSAPRVRIGSLRSLEGFVRWCRDNRIALLSTPPPVLWHPKYDEPASRQAFEAIGRWHIDAAVQVVLAADTFIHDEGVFFDTPYHLDAAAAEKHSRALAEALRSYVKSVPMGPPLASRGHQLVQLDRAFRGWEPLSGFGPVEGPYPQWELGGVIWAVGGRSSIAARSLGAGAVTVTASVRATSVGQVLSIYHRGQEVYGATFNQTTSFQEISFVLDAPEGGATLDFVHSHRSNPGDGSTRVLLFRSLRLENSLP